ncbi:hypothetical protein C8035_v004221 [Colletotrichum spinosum]|uniref:Uncharacterized protein n=1 Tax=Colletotrichum spinosum TaxID=1347390 RepID=A0A4R8Q7J3_9PEZI|nr:hypothetical protein C8035_v004221 [Colletotrichum spinosum]
MSFMQELWSFITPASLDVATLPKAGDSAPSDDQVKFPRDDRKPTVVAFLRHCGCPFAEKTFIRLREAASEHPDVTFVAVSHSSESHTQKWLAEVGGPGKENPVEVISNEERSIYANWGLGVSSFLHVLSPSALSEVFRLAREEGIKNRPTESGNRWQTSGTWAVDGKGIVRWGGPAVSASDIPDLRAAVAACKD